MDPRELPPLEMSGLDTEGGREGPVVGGRETEGRDGLRSTDPRLLEP